MDFSKLRPKTTRTTYRFRCTRCNEVADYTIDLREFGLKHEIKTNAQRCGGDVVLVSTTTEPKR